MDKTKSKTRKRRAATESVTYKLPADLVREIRIEAVDRRMWPAHVVAEKLAAAYQRKPAASA